MKLKTLLAATALGALMAAPALAQQISVKAGVLNDRSGIYADLSGEGSVIAARLAVEDFKAAEKGIKVEIVSADHQNKPDIAASIARKWFDTEGVGAIVDVTASSAALAVANVAKEKNRVFMATNAGSSDLTGKACNPNTVHWTYDSWGFANGTAGSLVKQGFDSWYFITVDYAYGHAVEAEASAVVKAAGGRVLGTARHPLNTPDFSSFLLQAQASKAKTVGLANAGGDTITSIKQAAEFGLIAGGQKLAGLAIFLTDVHSLGLEAAQGLTLTTWFYWDHNDSTRAFAKRFSARRGGRQPTMGQAGDYSATLLYLEAVKAAGGVEDGAKVVKAMRDKGEYEDPLFGRTHVRVDGRAVHPMYLAEVKKPSESKGPWDYYKIVAAIPPEQAARPLADSKAAGCSLVP